MCGHGQPAHLVCPVMHLQLLVTHNSTTGPMFPNGILGPDQPVVTLFLNESSYPTQLSPYVSVRAILCWLLHCHWSILTMYAHTQHTTAPCCMSVSVQQVVLEYENACMSMVVNSHLWLRKAGSVRSALLSSLWEETEPLQLDKLDLSKQGWGLWSCNCHSSCKPEDETLWKTRPYWVYKCAFCFLVVAASQALSWLDQTMHSRLFGNPLIWTAVQSFASLPGFAQPTSSSWDMYDPCLLGMCCKICCCCWWHSKHGCVYEQEHVLNTFVEPVGGIDRVTLCSQVHCKELPFVLQRTCSSNICCWMHLWTTDNSPFMSSSRV